jgi:hypothetical protein
MDYRLHYASTSFDYNLLNWTTRDAGPDHVKSGMHRTTLVEAAAAKASMELEMGHESDS